MKRVFEYSTSPHLISTLRQTVGRLDLDARCGPVGMESLVDAQTAFFYGSFSQWMSSERIIFHLLVRGSFGLIALNSNAHCAVLIS